MAIYFTQMAGSSLQINSSNIDSCAKRTYKSTSICLYVPLKVCTKEGNLWGKVGELLLLPTLYNIVGRVVLPDITYATIR
jgi:hypothetical protein